MVRQWAVQVLPLKTRNRTLQVGLHEGFNKGVELVRFEADSPVFSVDVSEDEVYVCGACQDGTGKIWRMPNAARYFGDNSVQGNQQNYYLGTNPMRDTETDRPEMNMKKE